MASYPGSVYSPASKSAGQTIQSAHVNDLDSEVVAVEDALKNGIPHAVTISTGGLTVSTGGLSIGGASSFSGRLVAGGGFQVSGNSTLGGNVQVDGAVNVSSNTVLTTMGVTGASTFSGIVTFASEIRIGTGASTLSGGSTTFNDITLGSTISFLRLEASTACSVTGWTGGVEGRVVTIWNNAAVTLTLQSQTGSLSSNQLLLSAGTPKALSQFGSAQLVYHGGFWRVLVGRD